MHLLELNFPQCLVLFKENASKFYILWVNDHMIGFINYKDSIKIPFSLMIHLT